MYYIEGDYIWGRKNKLFGWRSNINQYSLTLGAGIHIIDLINWLTGLKPISVYAVGNKKATRITPFRKNSMIAMIFKYPKDIIVKITANGAAIFDHFHEIKIFSDNHTLVNSRLGSYLFKKDKLFKIQSSYPDKKNRKKLIQNFIETLTKKKVEPIISLKEQIDLMTICFAVDKSVKLERKLKLNIYKFMKEIKFSIPNISEQDIFLVNKILKSGWLTHGKYTSLFEEQVKKFTKSKYAISVSSCTAGLHLSCLASDFKAGDEVIVPAQTHTATAHAVEYTGATPIFADVDFPSGNISLKEIKKKITKKTRGLILVHMAGYPCEIGKILNFCKKKKLQS